MLMAILQDRIYSSQIKGTIKKQARAKIQSLQSLNFSLSLHLLLVI